MTSTLVIIALVLLGFVFGQFLNALAESLQRTKATTFGSGPFDNWYSVIAGCFYFTTLFSIPISGNIPLFVLVAGIFLYSLYGRFGGEQNKDLKQEDKVVTKWYSGFP
ncbi:MAG: hypothetical protein GOV01_00825 [Candidatus Altiarchaeota archaeon]|nr:hypothetical protein [Candidatus Altiarchaeota archaeon]